MSLADQTPISVYTGNGVTTSFLYDFKIFLPTDLVVEVNDVVMPSVYSITNIGGSNGDVIFTVAPALDARITLYRAVSFSRSTDYQYQGDLPSDVINKDIDRVWMAAQELDAQVERSFRLPLSVSGVNVTLPTPVAGRSVKWSPDALSLVNTEADPDELADAAAASAAAAAESEAAANAAAAEVELDRQAAEAAAFAAAASAASTNLPASLVGKALNFLRVNAGMTGYEHRTPSQALSDMGGTSPTDVTNTVNAAVLAKMQITVRQAIQYGPTTGTPAVSDLIPQSQVGRTLAQSVIAKFSTAATLISIANGFNADGSPNNNNRVLTADLTAPALTASATNLIAYDYTNNVLVKSVVLDTDTKGGTPAITNGLYTYDYENCKMYLGNGAVANQVQHCVIAEVDTNTTVVTAIRCRAYKRLFEGAFTNTLPGSGVAMIQNSNIGTVSLVQSYLEVECLTTEYGFAVGDRICGAFSGSNGSAYVPITIANSRNTVRAAMVVGGAPWVTVAPSDGSFVTLTAARWKWRFVAEGGY